MRSGLRVQPEFPRHVSLSKLDDDPTKLLQPVGAGVFIILIGLKCSGFFVGGVWFVLCEFIAWVHNCFNLRLRTRAVRVKV